MADGSTTNHGFTLPEVGASKDSWGTKLNDNWTEVDALLSTTGLPATGTFVPLEGAATKTGTLTTDALNALTLSLRSNDINTIDDIKLTANGVIGAEGGVNLTANKNSGSSGSLFTFYDKGGDDTGGTQNGTPVARIGAAGTSMAQDYTVVTREKGDARYVNLDGDTMTGTLTLSASGTTNTMSISANVLSYSRTDGSGYIDTALAGGGNGTILFRNEGSTYARIGTVNTNGDVLQTRDFADARYIRLNTDTQSDAQYTFRRLVLLSNSVTTQSDITMAGSGVINVEDGVNFVCNRSNSAGASLYTFRDKEGTSSGGTQNSQIVAIIGTDGTSMPSVWTVATREKGDARYTQISSDATLKQNIDDMPDVLEGTLMQLTPRTYEWKVNPEDPRPVGTMFGMVAQEVEQVLPQAVIGEEGQKGLDALTLIGVLVKSVQELTTRVAALEA